MVNRRAIADLAGQLVGLLSVDVLLDLRREEPSAAIEVHFPPIAVRSLPPGLSIFGGSDRCSLDGCYFAMDPIGPPTIVYDTGVSVSRGRFTLLHELAHHLILQHAELFLDAIDLLAKSHDEVVHVEELVCHEFAGRVIIPGTILDDVVGDLKTLSSADVVLVHDSTLASWEATAVRLANVEATRAAIALIRAQGSVDFVAGGSHGWWPRGSKVKPVGPLDRVLRADRKPLVQAEAFRYSLPFEKSMYCDALKVDDDLAVAVLRPFRTDGRFDPLPEVSSPWDDVEFCLWCEEERTTDWCDMCNGRFCDSGHCGCNQRKTS